MGENKSSISRARSYNELSEFWDSHDLSEFWDQLRPAEAGPSTRSGHGSPKTHSIRYKTAPVKLNSYFRPYLFRSVSVISRADKDQSSSNFGVNKEDDQVASSVCLPESRINILSPAVTF